MEGFEGGERGDLMLHGVLVVGFVLMGSVASRCGLNVRDSRTVHACHLSLSYPDKNTTLEYERLKPNIVIPASDLER